MFAVRAENVNMNKCCTTKPFGIYTNNTRWHTLRPFTHCDTQHFSVYQPLQMTVETESEHR